MTGQVVTKLHHTQVNEIVKLPTYTCTSATKYQSNPKVFLIFEIKLKHTV